MAAALKGQANPLRTKYYQSKKAVSKPKKQEFKLIIYPDGTQVIGVYVNNAQKHTWLHKDDYERIIAQVGMRAWTMLHNGQSREYVCVQISASKKHCLYITRLIVGDIQGMSVRFKDGNILNLRSSSLYHDAGRGGEPLRKRLKLNVTGFPTGSASTKCSRASSSRGPRQSAPPRPAV